jgi:hypothetical protein
VKQVKNLQIKQEEAQEYKHRKQTAGKTSARGTHVVSGNPPTTDDLQKSRSAPCEAGKASHNSHARGQDGKPPACADHAPTKRELHDPPGNHRDRRGPKTASGRFLSKKSQLSLTDLTLNNISAGHSPTLVNLHEPETKSLCLLQSKTKKSKRKKKKQKQNNLHQCNTERKKTLTILKAWRQHPPLEERPRGNKTLALTAKGKQSQKTKPVGGGVRPPPGRQVSLSKDSLSRRLSDFLSLRERKTLVH